MTPTTLGWFNEFQWVLTFRDGQHHIDRYDIDERHSLDEMNVFSGHYEDCIEWYNKQYEDAYERRMDI